MMNPVIIPPLCTEIQQHLARQQAFVSSFSIFLTYPGLDKV